MRAALLALLLGCGGGASADHPPAIARHDLPRIDESTHVTVLADARPGAVVWVSATGETRVGAWAADLTPPRTPAVADVGVAVLETVIAGGGLQVERARAALATRATLERDRARHDAMQAQARQGDPLVPGVGRLPAADVDHLGKLAVLDVAFAREGEPAAPGLGLWLEVWVDATGVHLTSQPEDLDTVVPFAGASIDRTALATAYRTLDLTKVPVDVIVRDDTTVQTLVEVLVALRAIDVHALAVAAGPAAMTERKEQIRAAQTGQRPGLPSAQMGQPNVQGDLDKPTIRFTMYQHLAEIRACYERALARDPDLAGVIMTQFFITPSGRVANASVSGLDSGVEACVVRVLRGIEFPKPDGGGGVQVSYPFIFKPAS